MTNESSTGTGPSVGVEASVSDPWQLEAALAGDTTAWAKIVDDFGANVWYWARSQGLDREDAEDVCQTVWYQLKDKGHTIEDPRRLPGWLATTTRRQAIAVAQKRSRVSYTPAEDAVDTLVSPNPGAEEIAVAEDTKARLMAAFKTLRTRCQELLSLLWADVAYAEISNLLDMAIGSIGETRRRCLDQLRYEAGLT